MKYIDLRTKQLGFKSWPPHPPTAWPWAICLTYVCLSLLICKTGIIMVGKTKWVNISKVLQTMPGIHQQTLNETKCSSKDRGLKRWGIFSKHHRGSGTRILTPGWLLASKAVAPEWGCRGGRARRVKPPSEQKNKFHLVPGTKRQPAKPPARAPAQRTHCFLKFQLVAASIYKSTSSPHPRARNRIHKWQRDIHSENRHMKVTLHSGYPDFQLPERPWG